MTHSPIPVALTGPQRRALLTLMRAEGFDQRPCRDPHSWDLPPKPFGRRDDHERRIWDQLIEARKWECAGCPVLAQCAAYANTLPRVTGVIAGRLIGPAS